MTRTSIPMSHVQRALHHARQREIIDCQQASPTALYRLAARVFLPADGRHRFADPFPLMGKVIVAVLSRRPVIDDSIERDQVFFRGFTGRYDAGSGRTLWDESTAAFGYDLALDDADGAATLPPWKIDLVQAAIDLHRACVRSTWSHGRSVGFAVLPPTLLAIPSGFKLEPEPTPFVRIRAALDRTTITEAWQKLAATFRIPAERTGMDTDLIDSRLVHEQASFSLSEHHDLRAFLGRALFNPVRSARCAPFVPGQRVVNILRNRMRPDLAAACTDEDLRRALLDPESPLTLSGLSTVQVWRPPLTRRSCAAYQFEEAGVKADLWTTPRSWVDEVQPRTVRGAGFTVYQRSALCA